MRNLWLVVVGLLPGVCLVDDPAPTAPNVLQFDGKRIGEIRQRIDQGDAQTTKALEQLRKEADRALETPPLSVTFKPQTPPSGDKHDYISVAPYWWPDPSKPDGKPYIRRDGRTNPERNQFDKPKLVRLCDAVPTLALAYALTAQEPYAEHAARLLRTWFLDPATRMNPNLEFGQFVPGRNDGRSAGIIETRGLMDVVDAVGLIEGSKAWSERDTEAMRGWFRSYVRWLRTSAIGLAEDRAKNNHGSWYDAQVVTFALFVGDQPLARQVLESSLQRRIAAQVAPDGSQKAELGRTKSFDYSLFNLKALFVLANLGERVGVDLWRFETPDGRSIRRALDFMIPFATGAKLWTQEQINPPKNASLLPLLRRASVAYREPKYEQAFQSLIAAESRLDLREELLGPPPIAR